VNRLFFSSFVCAIAGALAAAIVTLPAAGAEPVLIDAGAVARTRGSGEIRAFKGIPYDSGCFSAS